MTRVAGYGGNIFVSRQVIDAANLIWETGGAGRTVSLDTTDYKVGIASAKVVVVGIGATTLLNYRDFSSLDLTGYTKVFAWVKSSINQSAGDCQLLLDNTSGCVSPLESIDIPALTAGEWLFVPLTIATPAALGAVISVGIKQVVDLADMSMWIDEIVAAKEVVGIKDWTLDDTANLQDTTSFSDGRDKVFSVTSYQWGGTFNGFKDGPPLSKGTVVAIELQESSTSTQMWRGSAIITGRGAAVPVDGMITYNYTYQGTHELVEPTT